MNKRFFFINALCVLIMTALCLSVTSCSDDDEKEPETPNVGTVPELCPDDNHPHAIDLGLPNGIKFACCNVGAHTPTQYGDFFAWGETETDRTNKSGYTPQSYKYYNSFTQQYSVIGDDISGTDYDVAHVLWKGDWRMPKQDDFYFLKYKCEKEWVEINGTKGVKFTGTNGNAIFMPASGYKERTNIVEQGSVGQYWTSQLIENDKAIYFYFDSNLQKNNSIGYRYLGLTVRPVMNR